MKSLFFGLIATAFAFTAQAQFTLPELKFPYTALEPHVDAQTMEIHHSKHHQAYIKNLNQAVAGTAVEKSSLEYLILHAAEQTNVIRNNAGGHYNHTLFWELLSPTPSKLPTGSLNEAILKSYTSLDSLKKVVNKAALSQFGSGWAWLIVTPSGKLAVTATANQDNPIMNLDQQRGIPILAIDVWEHAYYLKHQNKRPAYMTAIWEVIDWAVVSKKYDEALQSELLKRIAKTPKSKK
jgi:Fe-Mn family superoxide dismutase